MANKSITHIVLLTNSFPYGYGESFLEEEIKSLAETFEHITIYPFRMTSDARGLPGNVVVRDVLCVKSRLEIFAVNAMPVLFSKEYLQEALRSRSILNPIKLGKIFFYLCKGRCILNMLKDELGGADCKYVIYSYWMTALAYAAAKIADKSPDIYSISRAHGYDLYKQRACCDYLPFQQAIVGMLDAVIAISDDGKSYLNNEYRSSVPDIASKVRVYKLGVTPPVWRTQQPTREKTEFRFISCSSIIPVKNLPMIADVIRHFSGLTNMNVCWHHIGQEKGWSHIEHNIKSRLPDAIEVKFTGQISNKSVSEYYSENYFDLFINMSDSEGLPVSIMEAMSYSIPVLARDVGGVSEIVNNKNGMLVPYESGADEIANMLWKEVSIGLLCDKRPAAHREWNDRYNANVNYHAFSDYLRNIFDEK